MGWDGNDRRHKSRRNGDHDLLTRIDVNLSNFMTRFADHEKDDDKRFDGLFRRTASLQKFQWVAMGGLLIINVIIIIAGKFFLEGLQ